MLANNASNGNDIQVLFNNTIVTNNVTENGQGVDINDNEYITISFANEQTVDSVIILSNSNVESYSISYIKSDGSEYILDEVNIKYFY
jgi:hypothetical protein